MHKQKGKGGRRKKTNSIFVLRWLILFALLIRILFYELPRMAVLLGLNFVSHRRAPKR
ncbi:hypothetical protein [Allobaculum fili]|uniref:hypothetical protein n=1 Tax=Allobaculum TaxID=174708 RepID=UPI001E63B829|nr:hypothetical protein [Allobaculum fili]